MDIASVLELGWSDWLLLAFLIYVVYRVVRGRNDPSITAAQSQALPAMPKRDFTIAELAEYNGTDNERILLALLGKVYDVTRGKAFYGPGAAYGKLAGHDATRALATMDLEKVSDQYDDTSDLPAYELNEAKEWTERFAYKYPVVGRLLRDDEQHTDYKGELATL